MSESPIHRYALEILQNILWYGTSYPLTQLKLRFNLMSGAELGALYERAELVSIRYMEIAGYVKKYIEDNPAHIETRTSVMAADVHGVCPHCLQKLQPSASDEGYLSHFDAIGGYRCISIILSWQPPK